MSEKPLAALKNQNVAEITFADHTRLALQVFSDTIIRVCPIDALANPSYAVVVKPQPTHFTVQVEAGVAAISTAALHVKVYPDHHMDVYDQNDRPLIMDYRGQRQPLNRDLAADETSLLEEEGHAGHEAVNAAAALTLIKQLDPDEVFYGLGDKTGFMNKRGYEYENWNTDDPAPQMENFTRLYKSIPVLYGLRQGRPYGLFFDNPYRSHVDLGKESPDYYAYSVVHGPLNYYIIGGHRLADVVANYAHLTGTVPLPQRWTLGYQHSRYGYQDAPEINQIADDFRRHDLPCDALYFDIDYMHGYRVFTWDPARYPDPEMLITQLHKKGFKAVTIIDPGVKREPGYPIYDDGKKHQVFVKTPAGKDYVNRVWPGHTVYPDFGSAKTRQWWGQCHTALTQIGVDGIWNDMNEPAAFDGPIPDDTVFSDNDKKSTHAKMHNLYGHNMSHATYAGLKEQTGRRPFVITRAAYAGTQRYATVWTGDNHSLWAHLQMMIPQLCNLSMSGFSFAGTDLGGFGSDTTPELLTRWIEAGLFSPLFRNHSALGTRRQEPWLFGESTLAIYRKYLKLRYRFIPYLYDLFALAQSTGRPVMRPLVYDFDQDRQVYDIDDEYLIGDALLAAPVVTKGKTSRLVYLPAGQWIDFWTGAVIAGGQEIQTAAPLDTLPLYGQAGTMIPWGPAHDFITDEPDRAMSFKVFGDAASYDHYQDNGYDFAYQKGEFNQYHITFAQGKAAVTLTKAGYPAGLYSRITVTAGDQSFALQLENGKYQRIDKN